MNSLLNSLRQQKVIMIFIFDNARCAL